MKAKLFEGLSAQEVLDNLEAENCGVEDNHKFVKPFSEDEMLESRERLANALVSKSKKERQIKELTEPIKDEIKPLLSTIKDETKNLEQGGEVIYGKVYCFPDYESNLMLLYDSTGTLVDTRPLTRTERQLHINSFKHASNG